MKKLALKILCISLAVLTLCLCFTGCKKKNTTFVIGGTGPLTGATKIYGESVRNAAQLAVDEINANGGINGIQITFKFEDDEHKPASAVNAYNKLMGENIHVFLGTVTSDPCKAVVKEAERDNVFLLTPSGSALACVRKVDNDGNITGTYSNAFRVCFNDPDQGIGAANFIKNNMADVKKVGIIYNSSDVYSTGLFEKFTTQAASNGLEYVTQSYTNTTNTDFSTQINALKTENVDLVFLPIYYEDAASILTQANDLGLNKTFFGCDGLDGIIKQLGDKSNLAEGVMLLTSFAADSTDEKTKAFVEAYKAKYSSTPDQFAAAAYDGVYIIKAAIEKAGVTDPSISASELCDLLKVAMTEIEITGVTGTMTWDADTHEPNKTATAVVIENGVYKAYN